MKYSGIGGQAVMEGIMMRNGGKFSVAVRKPDGEIAVTVEPNEKSLWNNPTAMKIPILRGAFSFIDSLVVGMKTLMFSASFMLEEDEEEIRKENEKRAKKGKAPLKEKTEEEKKKEDSLLLTGTLIFSLLFSIAVFMLLPYFVSDLLRKVISSQLLISALEGVLRISIFLSYIAIISNMKDIKRTFMYHGAEHKCINCIEHGMELNVDNVMKSSKQHKRCGTSFLLIVMVVSILFFFFIRLDSPILRVIVRLALLPVIAGISFEFIRIAGRSESGFVALLSKPGMMLQNMTTKEPDREMAEVAIAAVEAVYDWRAFLNENFGYTYAPEETPDSAKSEDGKETGNSCCETAKE